MATNDQKQKAWESATTVRGKNPDLYRKDPYGNVMYKLPTERCRRWGGMLITSRRSRKGDLTPPGTCKL
jgi:hypothetical protein